MAGQGESWRSTTQVGLESTYGVAVPASRIQYLEGNPVLTRTRAPRPHQYATGTRDPVRAFTLGPAEVGGSIAFPISADEIIEWLLVTMQGAVTPTTPTGATAGRLWTFNGGGTVLDSMTFEYDDSAAAYRGYGIYGDQMTIAWDINGAATATFTLLGLEREAHALTGALASRTPSIIEGWEVDVFLAPFGGVIGSAQIPNFGISGSITFNNNLIRKFLANNRNRASKIITQPMVGTAQILVEAITPQALTELANWDATPVTKRILTLQLGSNDSFEAAINNVQTISQASTPSSGTFKLTVLGVQTGTIAYNANAAAIQTAINAALTAAFGSDYTVVVTGGPLPGTPAIVTFSGTGVAGRDLPLMTIDNTSVVGGTFTVANTTPGYSGKRTIWLDIAGAWSAADTGQTNQGTRAYRLDMQYVKDPTNNLSVQARVLNNRAAAW